MSLNKEIVVIMYKNRLVCFGFELIESIIKEASNGKINQKDELPEELIIVIPNIKIIRIINQINQFVINHLDTNRLIFFIVFDEME